jgi:hypothetical protein
MFSCKIAVFFSAIGYNDLPSINAIFTLINVSLTINVKKMQTKGVNCSIKCDIKQAGNAG